MAYNFDPNPLFFEMVDIYRLNKDKVDDEGKKRRVVICNEGGTRSSKTWDFYHFLVYYCRENYGKEREIYILRETLVKCRDFTLKEFIKCLKVIGCWDQSKFVSSPKPYYNLFGNHVYFRGMDDEGTEAPPSDIVFVNEGLETTKGQSKGYKMRCRRLFVYDWNPRYTEHWCFKMEAEPNTFFTHSTYKNNKHLESQIVTEVEGFEPWLPGSYEIIDRKLYYKGELITDKNQPPPHPLNVDFGTADEYEWKVYGLGLRGAMKGLLITNVVYEEPNAWPEGLDGIYVNDFGFVSDPNALIDMAIEDRDIWVRVLGYHPIETPTELNRFFESVGMDKKKVIIADSSDTFVSEYKGAIEMVNSIRQFGWRMQKISKKKGQGVMYWLGKLKEFRIHFIMDDRGLWRNAQIEVENYRLETIDGIQVNRPDPKCKEHIIDCVRYGLMSLSTNKRPF